MLIPDKTAALYGSLAYKLITLVITQIRTNKIGLAGYLYTLNIADLLRCVYYRSDETVYYILF